MKLWADERRQLGYHQHWHGSQLGEKPKYKKYNGCAKSGADQREPPCCAKSRTQVHHHWRYGHEEDVAWQHVDNAEQKKRHLDRRRDGGSRY